MEFKIKGEPREGCELIFEGDKSILEDKKNKFVWFF